MYTFVYFAKMENSSIWYNGQIRNLTLAQCEQYNNQLKELFNTKTFMARLYKD